MTHKPLHSLMVAAVITLTAPPVYSQDTTNVILRFEQSEAMIPMRDGVRLHTRIFRPKDTSTPLPIILRRTPYSAQRAEGEIRSDLRDMVDDGYIFVFQDIRGRYESEGTFVMMRPMRDRNDRNAIDETTDTYDTIEWMLANIPGNNRRVGMLGISYDGWLTTVASLDPHPALRAVSPQASVADMWLGDDFFHNGAFRLAPGFEYSLMMESSKENTPVSFDRYDTFDWYLDLGPLKNANEKYLKGKLPTWNSFIAHPGYDPFWQARSVFPHIRKVTVPTLNVGGWWDQEDFFGSIAIYSALEKLDDRNINQLVVGPWYHGSWMDKSGDKLGRINFGSRTAPFFRDSVMAPWFAYWLKDMGTRNFPEALTFESGTNAWRRWDAWPPRAMTTERRLHFRSNERLSFDAPQTAAADSFDAYVSDPAHPVPYRRRPIQPMYFEHGSGWYTWLVEDQRFVDDRPDVLSWESEVLEEDVTIAGEVVANLFASTTGSDADWYVKLIDVYPETYPTDWGLAGWQLMVSNEMFRGRYRVSNERPTPITPNEILPYQFSLRTQNYTFRRGHRIMVQVQSTMFPLIDRNPQAFVPNIFEAEEKDFKTQTHRIHRSARYPSSVTIPVVTSPTGK